jgi:hypothetical protein
MTKGYLMQKAQTRAISADPVDIEKDRSARTADRVYVTV